MADEQTIQGGEDQQVSGATPAANEFTPITSQDELDRRLAARLERERAKYRDFDQYKQAAQKLADLEEAQKTEQQRQADALAKLKDESASLKATNLRLSAAMENGIPNDLLHLVTGSTPDEIAASAKEAGQIAADRAELAALKAQIQAQADAPKPVSPNNGVPVAQLVPGATPAAVTVAEDAYPASWIPQANQ